MSIRSLIAELQEAKGDLDKILPRDVYVTLDRSSSPTSQTEVWYSSPSKGQLKAVKLGYLEVVEKTDRGVRYRRTPEGEAKYQEYERARAPWKFKGA